MVNWCMKILIIAITLIGLFVGMRMLVYLKNEEPEMLIAPKESNVTNKIQESLVGSEENDPWNILVAQNVDNKKILEREDVKKAMPHGQVSPLVVGVVKNSRRQCLWGAARNPYPPRADAPYGHQYLANCYTTYEGKAYYDGEVIEVADEETFEAIPGDERFARDKNRIYFSGEFIGAEIIDANTFEAINERYTKDKNFVYYFNENIEEGSWLALLEIIERADPNTFEVAGRYAKDKNYIFLSNKILQGVDLTTFQEMGERNYKDKDHAYSSSGKIIEDVDLPTLEDVPDGMGYYIKDKNYVFFSDYSYHYDFKIIDGADPKTFELIGKQNVWMGAYTKDKRYIYFGLKRMDGVDRESFTVTELGGNIAKDKNHSYFKDKIVE